MNHPMQRRSLFRWNPGRLACATSLLLVLLASRAGASAAVESLPVRAMLGSELTSVPVDNAAFAPGADALPAPDFAGTLRLESTAMQTLPVLPTPVLDDRDARLFPGVALGFVTRGEVLVPLQRGDMVRETAPGKVASYWRVIPQFGRVWREKADGEWSRAAFPLMLVNDTENHAHQGLATFLYKGGKVSSLRVQFVQQTAPYLLSPHSVLWGSIPATVVAVAAGDIETARREAAAELAARFVLVHGELGQHRRVHFDEHRIQDNLRAGHDPRIGVQPTNPIEKVRLLIAQVDLRLGGCASREAELRNGWIAQPYDDSLLAFRRSQALMEARDFDSAACERCLEFQRRDRRRQFAVRSPLRRWCRSGRARSHHERHGARKRCKFPGSHLEKIPSAWIADRSMAGGDSTQRAARSFNARRIESRRSRSAVTPSRVAQGSHAPTRTGSPALLRAFCFARAVALRPRLATGVPFDRCRGWNLLRLRNENKMYTSVAAARHDITVEKRWPQALRVRARERIWPVSAG